MLSTGGLFALTAWRIGWTWELPAYLVAAALAVACSAVDARTRRIPDALVLPAYPVLAGCLVIASASQGQWDALVRGGIGGMGLGAVYFLAALALPGGLGMGDVKLAGVLGLMLAYCGLSELAVGTLAAFALGGLWGIARSLGRPSAPATIAFAPWMCAGAALGVGFGPVIAQGVLRALL
jgi:leader peptidase (prepilin peptidase)/N-methyltransferase